MRQLIAVVVLFFFGLGQSSFAAAQSDTTLNDAAIRKFLSQMKVSVDAAKSRENMIVTTTRHATEGEIIIVIALDPLKGKLGLYTYNFGNIGKARDEITVLRRLLDTNNAVAIGSFFVDEEKDIGFKYNFGSARSIDFESFNTVYFAMVNSILKYRSEIKAALETEPGDKATTTPPKP